MSKRANVVGYSFQMVANKLHIEFIQNFHMIKHQVVVVDKNCSAKDLNNYYYSY